MFILLLPFFVCVPFSLVLPRCCALCLRVRMPAEEIIATSPFLPHVQSEAISPFLSNSASLRLAINFGRTIHRVETIRLFRSRELMTVKGYSGIAQGESGTCLMSPVKHVRNSVLYYSLKYTILLELVIFMHITKTQHRFISAIRLIRSCSW